MNRLNWKPIEKQVIEAAKSLGHTVGAFKQHRNRFSSGNVVKTATCDTCYGCCWVAYQAQRGGGGRILIHRCGTPEAMGLKAQQKDGSEVKA